MPLEGRIPTVCQFYIVRKHNTWQSGFMERTTVFYLIQMTVLLHAQFEWHINIYVGTTTILYPVSQKIKVSYTILAPNMLTFLHVLLLGLY